MKQIIQSFKNGETILEEIPTPQVKKGTVLIRTSKTLVSLGTEKMLIEFGKSNLISKARKQPDKVKQVLDKIKTEGLLPTLEAVCNKLGEPIPLGYCNVGRVVAVGEGVIDFKINDRVASNGSHAEYVCVPKNLVAHIPDNVSDEEATFTVIGSIGLQGIRLLNPSLGETVVVIGLGLIGLLTAQLLVLSGCKVIGVDIDKDKLEVSEKWGVIPFNPQNGDVVKFLESVTAGNGADGVIITASSKQENLISQAAQMLKKRGKIILIGVIPLNMNRSDFYEKEISFQVSCSYGPGRYDEEYEQRGTDYPFPFVRWTEKRNFQAILGSLSESKLNVKGLITEVVELYNFKKIYESIGTKKSIASILSYSSDNFSEQSHSINIRPFEPQKSTGVIGIIGSGNFSKMTMLPSLKNHIGQIKYIASANGISGTSLAKKYGIAFSTTNYHEILNDAIVDLVIIATRHDKHSKLCIESLNAGKNVFIEKPLAISYQELNEIIDVYNSTSKNIMVGFNRRFSPHSLKVKSILGSGPISVIITVNAGYIPKESWIHDINIGGGRLIGEACHFIDLISFLSGSKVISVSALSMGINPSENSDVASILLKYENGSIGSINYFANGSKAYPKERVEVFANQRTVVVDNFRETTAYGFKGFSKLKTSIDKGHKNQFKQLVENLQSGCNPLIPFNEIVNTTLASFAVIESLKTQQWVKI